MQIRSTLALSVVAASGVVSGVAVAQPILEPEGSREVMAFWGDYVTKPSGDNYWKGNRRFRSNNGTIVNGIDLDNDGLNDDSTVYYAFSLVQPMRPNQFDPQWPEFEYHIDEHGATYFGGVRCEYLNMTRSKISQSAAHIEGANFNYIRTTDGHWGRRGGPSPEEQRAAYTEVTLFPYHPPEHVPGQASRFHSYFLWRKAEFHPWAQARPVTFDENSRITYTFARKYRNIQEARFVLQDGDGTFYVSENWALFGVEDLWGDDMVLNPADLTWAPTAFVEGAASNKFDESSAVFAAHEFSDVLVAGLYFASDWSEVETKLAFDQFRLFAAEPCMADMAAPWGVLDFFDVQSFLGAFSSGDMAADINEDGILDFFDVQSYLTSFSAGCP